MQKNNITKRAFRQYRSYNPNYFPRAFLKILFDNIAPYFTLWMSSEIVTALYEGRARETVYALVGITLAGNLAVHVLGAILTRSADTQREILDNNEAAAFNAKTLSLDYDKLEDSDIRQHRRKIIENSWINYYGVQRMRLLIEQMFESAINIVFSLILFGEMLLLLIKAGMNLTSVLLLGALLAAMVFQFMARSFQSTKLADAWKAVGDFMLEENKLSGGYSVADMDNRVYRQQILLDRIDAHMNKSHQKVMRRQADTEFQTGVPITLAERASGLCSYLVVCLYCAMGAFPVGSVIKYVGYLGRLTGSIGSLLMIGRSFQDNEQFLAVYMDYFDIKNDMYQGSLAVEKRSDRQFEIQFRDVSFRYQGAEDYALKHINLNLNVGERLAVVGRNGSGKTTFIKLLCRLYDPTEGEVIMNDFNIRKYDYRQYLDLFSVVFQDYKLLAVPLGNNVASSDVWDVAKAERLLEEVGFGERYAQMPKKLDTSLYKDFDEDGVNVSGGEAQKIALARALYKDAPFIILDEPTAALDPIAEAEIYSRFDEIVGDKTAIYISHRLSSCRFCDKIAVFDQGEIVQVGTHEELLADPKGKYYELWNAQAQYYAKDAV